MKPHESLPEDRLLDDLVSTPEREEFFASVEQDLLSKMSLPAAVAPRRNGWIVGSVLVAASAITAVTVWYATSEPSVEVAPQAPYQTSAPAGSVPRTEPPSASGSEPVATPDAVVPADAPALPAPEPAEEPTTMMATARSSSPIAVRAMREVDSLRTLLASEQDVQQQLTLRYDIGVRLRLGGQYAEAEQHLVKLSADAQNIGATQLSARAQQQAAVSAKAQGNNQRARALMINAINDLPDGETKLRTRWQKDLDELR